MKPTPLGLLRMGLCLLCAPGPVAAADPPAAHGVIEGAVHDERGNPLPYTNVLLLGTDRGEMTNADGRFRLAGVPSGSYVIRVTYLGFESQERAVEVGTGQTVSLPFTLREAVVMTLKPVVVDANRDPIDLEGTDNRYRMDEDEISGAPVDDLQQALALQPGLVVQAGQLRARGERTPIVFQVDGVAVSDPSNGSNASLANIAIESAETLVGGLDAEFGNAQAGVVNLTTKSGGDTLMGEVNWETDDFGAPDRTYTNLDRVSIGLGGPTPLRGLTYFVSGQGSWTDTDTPTRERRDRTSLLDFVQVGPRQNNHTQLQGKLTWAAAPGALLALEVLDSCRSWDAYQHTFSAEGFVETRSDTVEDTGALVTRYGAFSPGPEGPGWVYYNAAAHTPNYTDTFRTLKAGWNHHTGRQSFYSVRLSRSRFRFTEQVAGKEPWEYEVESPQFWTDRINFTRHPFFATHGDYPAYSDRTTTVWSLRTDYTAQVGDHQVKSGVQVAYNDLENFNLLHPNRLGPDGTPGLARSEYHVYNPEGSVYLQDRWEHEGMVVNAGMRYDVFSVGDQLNASQVDRRTRDELSPRLGIAYPISDRDVFSFHYGRFSQTPDRRYIFENRSPSVPVRGNPNLDTQTTVAYQAALQHLFTEDVFGQFSVYFKDIYGLISSQELSSGDSPDLVRQWSNLDYASSRGFEVSINKTFSHFFRGRFSYSYGSATGVASDPNVQSQVDFLYLPISEQPLDWDQRHTVSLSGVISRPGNWSMNFIYSRGSGFPYTPYFRAQRQADPALTNSLRLPGHSNLTLEAEKHYRVWGQMLSVHLRVDNLLDTVNVDRLAPANWPSPPGLTGNDYETFYTETGRAGGAYLDQDVNEDGEQDWVALNDPRVFSPGRSVRFGLSVLF